MDAGGGMGVITDAAYGPSGGEELWRSRAERHGPATLHERY